ncbi:sialic acid-binding Ig-like lectin 5 [Stegastes partitus]|uniref:Sialic acid-binding Ig-like lectin 5 n=1 Tax=Stegastes partitus TaxID=144197 RepID=A0A9Y4KFT0_9TELE|nr:PREDICTED: sialic acid-binding Ig-like lectin 5 [Stegastes partitus]
MTLLFKVRSSSASSDLSRKPSVMIPALTEGHQATLTCTAPARCSGSDPEFAWTWGGTDRNSTGNATDSQGRTSTLTFQPSAEHHNAAVTCRVRCTGNQTTEEEETVTLNVTYVKKPEITGTRTVKEGDALNLTCTADSFPPAVVTWTKHGANKSLINDTEPDLNNGTGTSALIIQNVTTEDSGQFVCTAKQTNNSLIEKVEITVKAQPKILNGSGCEVQSEVLTCVCISQGFPLPAIEWPLLENLTDYFVLTAVSNHTINSTIILSAKGHSDTSAVCVSRSKNGETKGNLIVNEAAEEGQSVKWFRIVTQLETVITFLIGTVFSAIIFCLAWTCCRNRNKKTHGNLAETVEMGMIQEDPLIVEDDQIQDLETLEEAEATAAGKSDVEYSDIDFSLSKRKSPAEAGTTETDYAEIKKAAAVEGDEGQVLGEDEETKHCPPEEQDGEDVAVYSNVQDIMGQV